MDSGTFGPSSLKGLVMLMAGGLCLSAGLYLTLVVTLGGTRMSPPSVTPPPPSPSSKLVDDEPPHWMWHKALSGYDWLETKAGELIANLSKRKTAGQEDASSATKDITAVKKANMPGITGQPIPQMNPRPRAAMVASPGFVASAPVQIYKASPAISVTPILSGGTTVALGLKDHPGMTPDDDEDEEEEDGDDEESSSTGSKSESSSEKAKGASTTPGAKKKKKEELEKKQKDEEERKKQQAKALMEEQEDSMGILAWFFPDWAEGKIKERKEARKAAGSVVVT